MTFSPPPTPYPWLFRGGKRGRDPFPRYTAWKPWSLLLDEAFLSDWLILGENILKSLKRSIEIPAMVSNNMLLYLPHLHKRRGSVTRWPGQWVGFLITDQGNSLHIYKRITLFFSDDTYTSEATVSSWYWYQMGLGVVVKMMLIKKGEIFPLSLKQETSNTFSMWNEKNQIHLCENKN